MKYPSILILLLLFPIFATAQFTIGQTSGANISYHDFPDTTIFSIGRESIELDLDGDLNVDIKVKWITSTVHQECWFRTACLSRAGNQGTFLKGLPMSFVQGNVISNQTFYHLPYLVKYCADYLDSTIIHRVEEDFFGPVGEDYVIFQLDSAGTDFAWLRAATDTLNGNYSITFKDAARYRAPVSVVEELENYAGLEVYPSLVRDELWLKGEVSKPLDLELTYVNVAGQVLLKTKHTLPAGGAREKLEIPRIAGMVYLQLKGAGVHRVEKLIFSE